MTYSFKSNHVRTPVRWCSVKTFADKLVFYLANAPNNIKNKGFLRLYLKKYYFHDQPNCYFLLLPSKYKIVLSLIPWNDVKYCWIHANHENTNKTKTHRKWTPRPWNWPWRKRRYFSQSSDERWISIVNFLEAVWKKLKVIFSVQRLKVLWLFPANSRLAPVRL